MGSNQGLKGDMHPPADMSRSAVMLLAVALNDRIRYDHKDQGCDCSVKVSGSYKMPGNHVWHHNKTA